MRVTGEKPLPLSRKSDIEGKEVVKAVEPNKTSTADTVERTVSDEPATTDTEKVAARDKAETAESIGTVEQSEEPEKLVRPGTIDQPADKRTTERVDKQDQAEELRKSISVYA